MTRVDVAAGVLRYADGRYLLAERPLHKRLGGYLEFPGGKLESGESPQAALIREFEEETGVIIDAMRPLVRFEYVFGDDHHVRVWMFRITAWHGTARGREGQRLIHAASSELHTLPLLPANRPILAALELPATLVVTPKLTGTCSDRNFTARCARALAAAGPGAGAILRIRRDFLGAELRASLSRLVEEETDHPLFLNAGEICTPPSGFSGLHLPASVLAEIDRRPDVEGWIGASVHTPAEAAHARSIGLDYVIAGSVRETPSHPGITPLGWGGFEAIVAAASMPTYAIGGMTPSDQQQVNAHWGQGIAAVRSFWLRPV